jgi:lipoprotein-releasing system permease protein
LNLYNFISQKIQHSNRQSFSFLVRRIAILLVFISFFSSTIALCVLFGFKNKIKEKVLSFSAHLMVSQYDVDQSYEETPFTRKSVTPFIKNAQAHPEVKHVQCVAHKPCLLKSKTEIQGIILKGISTDFDTTGFNSQIIEGRMLKFNDTTYSKEIVISKKIATKLSVKRGDSIWVYFVQNPPRYRKVAVVGVYETGLEELDQLFVLSDIKINQQLAGWSSDQVGAIEIQLNHFNHIDTTAEQLFNKMDYNMQMQLITDKYVQIFDWLDMLDRNVFLFLILLILVSGFVVVATLIVMIMERTSTIGLFKALGAQNKQIRKIFTYSAFEILWKGILSGVSLGVFVSYIQYVTSIIPLDAQNYYMNAVPIEFPWLYIVGLAVLGFILLLGTIVVPTYFISRVNPIKAIKFS